MAQVRIRRRKQKIIASLIDYEITGGGNCAETGFLDRLSLLSLPVPVLLPTASLVQAKAGALAGNKIVPDFHCEGLVEFFGHPLRKLRVPAAY